MRFMRVHTQNEQSRRAGDGSLLRNVPPPAAVEEDARLGRCEAQAIISPATAADPYAAWLERRESERRLRERPDVRWVSHPPNPGELGACSRGGAREAPADRGPGSPGDGLISVV
jgi:hypothetical protein